MSADEIRAEAIERVARALAGSDTSFPDIRAHHVVDALGDLLPTSLECQSDACPLMCEDGHFSPWVRYVTDWRADA